MINRETKEIKEKKEVIASMTCDVCGKTYLYDKDGNSDDVFEIQEFVHINFTGGYGSTFGDGDEIALDMCQHCLKEKLGAYLRIDANEF